MADVSKIKLTNGNIRNIKDAALRTEFDRVKEVTDAAIDDLSDIKVLNNLDMLWICSDGDTGWNVQHIYTDHFGTEDCDYMSVQEMANDFGYSSVSEFQNALPSSIWNRSFGSKRFTNTGNSIVYDGIECIIFEVFNYDSGEWVTGDYAGIYYYAIMPVYISLSILQQNSIKSNVNNHLNPFVAWFYTDTDTMYCELEQLNARGISVLWAE